jgi:cell division protein FtsB
VRAIFVALISLFFVLQYELWFSPAGAMSVWELKQTVDRQTIENLAFKKRDEALIAEIKDLKNGNQSIEEHARNDLGMIREGETFYQVIDR